MRKKVVFIVVCVCLGFFASACAKKPAGPGPGAARAEDALSLLPKDSHGVIVVDLSRLMKTAAVSKALQEDKNAASYQKFVETTGIDPQKDLFFLAAAMTGEIGSSTQDGVAIVSMKYDKEKILAALSQEEGEPTRVEYNGFTIYQTVDKDKEDSRPMSGVFLNDASIALGTETAVKQVIDVYQKKAENIWKSQDLVGLLKSADKTSMVWGAIAVPPQAAKQATSQNPMLGAFSEVSAVLMAFDSKDNNISLDIRAMSPNAEKNKQMAETLIGFKSLGGAAVSSKEPLLGDLLNKIEITSAADHVKISAVIPEELIQTLSQKLRVQKSEEER